MTAEEIKQLAQKFHTPGDPIKKKWNPEYIKECEKINRKHLEAEIMKKYERVKRFV
jgi:hypothetical protein